MINGLTYIKNYITDYQHDWLIDKIDAQLWLSDLKRRVQHYGYKYDYRARKIDHTMRLGDLPEWLKRLSAKICKDGYARNVADQVIINEYLPGQGISPHIDCEPCFEDTIISLSLGSACVMDFIKKVRGGSTKSEVRKDDLRQLWLKPKMLLIMQGEARYDWLHSIRARKTDKINNTVVARERRVSLTFRNVILN